MKWFWFIPRVVLAAAVIAVGFVLWLFLTPVTQDNVSFKAQPMCEVPRVAILVMGIAIFPSADLEAGMCDCIGEDMQRQRGAAESARLYEIYRNMIVTGISDLWSDEKTPRPPDSNEQDIKSMLNAVSTVVAACERKLRKPATELR